jgi:flagellar hook-associated protein 3 FlgL
MSSIIPIPTTRVGDWFVRQRLVGQVQSDQLDLFKLQNQISTGRRLQLPSDDAPAALRAINLQRLLDRKGQIQTNVKASSSYLSEADAQLSTVSDILNDLRGGVVGIAGTLSNDADRQTLVQQIDQAMQTLVAAGNAKSQGRYLFAGSRSQDQPYDFNGTYVQYSGNQGVLRSFVDLERLFDTNLAGTDVFGGISNQIQGGELNPQLSASTLLGTINGGQGFSRNGAVSVSINTGTSTKTSVVDLSRAVTVGDVTRLIEQGAPAGTEIVADVTGAGLKLSTTSGTITVAEVADGKAASELGILTPTGAPATSTLIGKPLNPAVLKTTPLDSLLGSRAQGRIESADKNNDIVLTSAKNGTDFNDVDVVFLDDATVTAGSEFANYDSNTKILTVHVDGGFSTAAQAATAITAEGTFTAAADYRDATSLDVAGTNPVDVGDFGQVTSGGSGENLDITSGLVLTNGGKTVTLDTSAAVTVEDLMNLINGSKLGLSAEINANRDGIDVRSRLSGADFAIGENGGTTAKQLGIRTYTLDTSLSEFNRGVGVATDGAQLDTAKLDNLQIVARDGTTLNVSLAGSVSLQDVVDRINSAAGNNVGTTVVLARLTSNHNGIELVDSSSSPVGGLTVQTVPGSQAAEYLGFIAPGAASHSSTVSDQFGNDVISGTDTIKNDFTIVASNGTELWIDLAGAKSVQDVINRINNDPANTGLVTARIAEVGNGIDLVDTAGGAGAISVRSAEGSNAARELGFVATGQTQTDPTQVHTDGSGNKVLTSADHHMLETDSVFNTLLRLKTALQQNDTEEIGRSLDRLDTDMSRVSFARSEIGSRIQSLNTIGSKLQDENVQLKSALSDDMDVDLVEAISNMTARQYAFQASLQTAGNVLKLSLLDFI